VWIKNVWVLAFTVIVCASCSRQEYRKRKSATWGQICVLDSFPAVDLAFENSDIVYKNFLKKIIFNCLIF